MIIVERFDRVMIDRRTIRIHQEDCCQALGRMPEVKYQNQGIIVQQDIDNWLRFDLYSDGSGLKFFKGHRYGPDQ